MPLRERQIVHAQRNSRQQQFGQHCFAAHGRCAKEFERRTHKPLGFEQASFVEQHQGFIQIDERRPDLVLVAHEHFFRLRKQLYGLECLPVRLAAMAAKASALAPS